MAPETTILFDLPSRSPCTAWSLNPWKTRLLLNYKRVDYKTEWCEYPDIKQRLEKHVPANAQGTAYTIPTVMFPDRRYVMDSRKIATVIEESYPEPSVHLDSPYLAKLEDIMARLMPQFRPIYLPAIPKRILSTASQAHWYSTREKMVGMPLDQLEKEKGGERAWAKVEPLFREVTELLKEDGAGPFFKGRTVSYADFVWAGFLIFLQCIGPDVYGEFLRRSGDAEAHAKLLEAVRPWSERNNR
ncbi:Glutathione S-transferase [Pleurostoma richardsiae]|uniref:Glutathione S-transferase n=1 Tax=Pleurostoma richardsiae TaxID=41990 RepID=A0AA38RJF9_9PEZI|nr:Glutathione S-transferase [Pleurostoma richardsiae]